jgi:hypothetical protein
VTETLQHSAARFMACLSPSGRVTPRIILLSL